jgi:class 3 adenylate cyclase
VSVLSMAFDRPTSAKDRIERHDEEIRGQLLAAGGREIKRSGGRLVAVFQRPTRLIQCAIAIRDRLGQFGLDVRSAVHIGECEQRGDDFSGIAVELSWRLLDHARPAEIIVSRTVRDLVVGSGLTFEERGEMQASGLPGALQFFSVNGA